MRILKSTQIAIGAVVIGAAIFFGYPYVADRMLGNVNFPNLKPGTVNLIGIDLGKGYAIRVVNQMAQLVEVSKESGFAPTESDSEGATEGSNAKRIPIKDMLAALQGDETSLGRLIMIMNDRGENDSWPPERILWKADDIDKALKGDPALRKKLEFDLNISLDGTPVSKLRIKSYQDGIIVESGVPVTFMVGGERKTLLGRIQTPYRPELMSALDNRLKDKSEISQGMIVGYYAEEAQKILSGRVGKENVRGNLKALIDPAELEPLAVRPTKILDSAKVVITDAFVTDAKYSENENGKDSSYDVTLDLNDEGRRRLWSFSRGKVNAQLLLISNGIAIAAPRIRHELATTELTITQLHDKALLDDMMDLLHKSAGKK